MSEPTGTRLDVRLTGLQYLWPGVGGTPNPALGSAWATEEAGPRTEWPAAKNIPPSGGSWRAEKGVQNGGPRGVKNGVILGVSGGAKNGRFWGGPRGGPGGPIFGPPGGRKIPPADPPKTTPSCF